MRVRLFRQLTIVLLVSTPGTAQAPDYSAIVSGDPREQLQAIDTALRGQLAPEFAAGRVQAATAFSYGPIVSSGRPVPPELVRALVTATLDLDGRVRREALLTLGSIEPSVTAEDCEALIALLKHDDRETRASAADVLGRLRVHAAADALIDAINDRDDDVKSAAMRALGRIRDDRAVRALNDQLAYHHRGPIALAAFEGLAGIAHGSSVATFENGLGDRESAARRLAAEGLGQSGAAAGVPTLEAAIAKERDAFARLAMAYGLCRLGRPFHDRLASGLRSDRTAPQTFAYFLELGAARDEAAVRTLEGLSNDRDERVRTLASRAIDRLRARP
jgi:HEAT repeats